MKTGSISELFEDGGLVITNSDKQNIFDHKFEEIVALFEKYGVILFRRFELEAKEITKFTDIYTEKYARDAYRRKIRFEEKNIRDVDLGRDAHTLHSEGSYSPASPEIIWFYCNKAPSKGGETILCDGIRLWKNLSTETKAFFLAEPLKFNLKIPIGLVRKKKDNQIWISNTPGTSGHIDWNSGMLVITQLQYAIQTTRSNNSLSFSNHLLAELGKDSQIINRSMLMSSGGMVPKKYLSEIKNKSAELTFEHFWENNDLLMIDNKRFMHGRNSFGEGIERDILLVQTERASFSYGSTTRKQINNK